MALKVLFKTFGCKVNMSESSQVSSFLNDNGMEIVKRNDIPDVVVINSCCVTNESERKVKQAIRHSIKKYPNAHTFVMGCYTRTGRDDLLTILDDDHVISDSDTKEIAKKIIEVSGYNFLPVDNSSVPADFSFRTRATVKVQDGCNMFCSYCIIPYARGRSTSLEHNEILRYVEKLAKNGYTEVVLTGIHISSYKSDDKTLINLIEDVSKLDGIKRIRLGSLEPRVITKDFLNRVKAIDSFCHHFHLSLQSGSTKVLKMMNRHYTREEYVEICDLIRSILPDAMITTDIITGFPQETLEDFEESKSISERVMFSHVHAFPYSIKEGTKASFMDGQISSEEKHRRCDELISFCEKISQDVYSNCVGNDYEILVESNKKGEGLFGYTMNYLPCYIETELDIEDKYINVTVTGYNDKGLIGRIKEE